MTTIYRFVFDTCMYPAITSNSEMRFRSLPNIYDIPKALLNPTSKNPFPVISKKLFIAIFKGIILISQRLLRPSSTNYFAFL